MQWLSPQTRRSAYMVDTAEWGADAAPAPQATPPAPAWRIGQSVAPRQVRRGRDHRAEGRGNDARVQVNFRDAGVKWLALEYAKLDAA